MRVFRKFVLVIALVTSACGAEASSVRTGPELPDKPASAPIAVFYGCGPDASYVEVGMIHVRTIGGSLAEVVTEVQTQARRLGADAVIVDLRYHYGSLPVSFDAAGRAFVEQTPKLNARVIAISFSAEAPITPCDPTAPEE